ncbi:hypothetical protein HNQ91_005894 [Filimonas zeae]|uniref:Uncharacterized protein n=1 Tax=Filimonas zeae TaxID=1737353 RepID=A0A917J616_9BACT|nr:hypothetical protein [Filimonas zeae]MDR6342807.1 hypothetical protein [Filimonas zeae]GGH82781.1 hypothetical protein GCM10011379_57180 [Filimonas zeae]
MTTRGLWVNPIGGMLYFGIDAYYPNGWDGATQMMSLIEANERAMVGHNMLNGVPKE